MRINKTPHLNTQIIMNEVSLEATLLYRSVSDILWVSPPIRSEEVSRRVDPRLYFIFIYSYYKPAGEDELIVNLLYEILSEWKSDLARVDRRSLEEHFIIFDKQFFQISRSSFSSTDFNFVFIFFTQIYSSDIFWNNKYKTVLKAPFFLHTHAIIR